MGVGVGVEGESQIVGCINVLTVGITFDVFCGSVHIFVVFLSVCVCACL